MLRKLSLGPSEIGSFDYVFLIVNADDYCYSEGVSRGILETIKNGIVTATGVLANSPNFETHISKLLEFDRLDIGVHLTLTSGKPLTGNMCDLVKFNNWEFPKSKARMAGAILSGKIKARDVYLEWKTQIQRCRDSGISVKFLNSHEHLHSLPPLLQVVHRLMDEYNIRFLRNPRAEWFGFPNIDGLYRNIILQFLYLLNYRYSNNFTPTLIGVNKSGKLDLEYFKRRLPTLQKGRVYELMCHPGFYDTKDNISPRLLAYHDWKGELDTFCSESLFDLCQSNAICLIGFSDLTINGDILQGRTCQKQN